MDPLSTYRSFLQILNTCNMYPECLLKIGPSAEVPNTELQLCMGFLCLWLLTTCNVSYSGQRLSAL